MSLPARRPGPACVPVLLALAAVPLQAPDGSGQEVWPRPVPERSCKPSAPIALELEEVGRAGAEVELRYRIEPRMALTALAWELLLPDDALLAAGRRLGVADPGDGRVTEGRATLGVPAFAAYRRVELVARGTFEALDEDGGRHLEEVVASRALTYGAPPPLGPVVLSPDDDGELVPFVVLATRHRPGSGEARLAGTRLPPRPAPTGAAGAATFLVTGAFEYEDKEWNYNGWTGNDPSAPIRRADVTVVDDATQTVLGQGTSAADGSFAISCTSVGLADVVVRVNSDTNRNPFQRIVVRDQAPMEYTAFSPVFAGHDTSTNLDVGTSTVLKSSLGGDEGNPFNLLDQAVHLWEYVTGPAGASASATTVYVTWPAVGGSHALGQYADIGPDDGYDDALILHELAHVVHNLYSHSDNPGGSHVFGDSDQDPRLSLGEGFATFLGGVVQIEQEGQRAIYMDCVASSQNGGVRLRLRHETQVPWNGISLGAADEVAVCCTLYDILDDEDSPDQDVGVDDDPFVAATTINGKSVHRAFWEVFVGPVKVATDLTTNDVWDGWFSVHGVGGLHPELQAVFGALHLDFFDDQDEPNDSFETATPITPKLVFSKSRTLYHGSGNPPVPGTGDLDWYSLDLVVGSIIDAETRYPDGSADADTQANTHVRLQAPSGAITEAESGGVGRNGAIKNFLVTESGTWGFRVRTKHSYRRYGRYDYRIRYVFRNFVPQIVLGPTATPAVLGPAGGATQLFASATDDQPVSYAWTPLDGGTIVGTGPTVTFLAPPVAGAPRVFRIELVVADSLGAQTDPVRVKVTVDTNRKLVAPGSR